MDLSSLIFRWWSIDTEL